MVYEYEITYNYYDNDGFGGHMRETFKGSRKKLDAYIEKLRRSGCYDIEVRRF